MISFERHLNELKTLKLRCQKVGSTKQSSLNKMINIFKTTPKTIIFNTYYQEWLMNNTVGIFNSKNWQNEGIQIEVQEMEPINDFPELIISLRPYLLFGVIDCEDGAFTVDDLNKLRKKAVDEKLVRFLILNCVPEMINVGYEKQFIIIPNLSDDKLIYYLDDQIQLFACQVIEHLAYEIIKLRNDTSQIAIFNVREEKINDIQKLKKRKQARFLKIIGDIQLLVNDFNSATETYKQALELFNKNTDHLWLAFTHQSLAALKWDTQIDATEEHFRESLVLLKKTKFQNLEIECFFKSMQFRRDIKDKLGLDKTVNIFLKTFDPDAPTDKCKFYVFVSELYSSIGMIRKQAFYLKLASNYICKINKPLSMELMRKAAKLYGLGQFFGDEDTKIFWMSMQQMLAQEIQQQQDEIIQTNGIDIIQLFKTQYSYQQLEQMHNNLRKQSLQQLTVPAYLQLIPKISKIEIEPYKGIFRVNQVQQAEKKDDSIFIVNPWSRKEQSKVHKIPINHKVKCSVYLVNPYSFELVIDCIQVDIEGVECLIIPKSLRIPSNSSQIYNLYFIPKQIGFIKINGIFVQFMNFTYLTKVNQFGYVNGNEQANNQNHYNLYSIEIIEELPDVEAKIYRDTDIINDIEVTLFDPTELFSYQVIIENKSCRLIQNLEVEICVESEDPPIYEYKYRDNIQLEGYSSQNLIFKDRETNFIQIPKIPHKIQNIKKITLQLYFWFDGAKLQREIKLIRIIKMKPKLQISKCLFVSKYESQNEIKEIYDLQDTCYLKFLLTKIGYLYTIKLESPILCDGMFQDVISEDQNELQAILKLKKVPYESLINPSLQLHWKCLLDGTEGILNPLDYLRKDYLTKNCCNNLIDVQCKEQNKIVSYQLTINQNLTDSEYVLIQIQITQEKEDLSHSGSKSIVSSIKQQGSIIILEGLINYRLQLKKNQDTIQKGELSIQCHGQINRFKLKVQVTDKGIYDYLKKQNYKFMIFHASYWHIISKKQSQVDTKLPQMNLKFTQRHPSPQLTPSNSNQFQYKLPKMQIKQTKVQKYLRFHYNTPQRERRIYSDVFKQ